MTQVISFVSNASYLDQTELETLLTSVQAYNNNHQIKGGLVFLNNTFFQIFEGDAASVKAIYHKICNDQRHHNIIKIYDQVLTEGSHFEQFDFNIITKNKSIASQELQRLLDFNAINIPQLYTFLSYQAIKLLNFTPIH